jgi:hypothetical protein
MCTRRISGPAVLTYHHIFSVLRGTAKDAKDAKDDRSGRWPGNHEP